MLLYSNIPSGKIARNIYKCDIFLFFSLKYLVSSQSIQYQNSKLYTPLQYKKKSILLYCEDFYPSFETKTFYKLMFNIDKLVK